MICTRALCIGSKISAAQVRASPSVRSGCIQAVWWHFSDDTTDDNGADGDGERLSMAFFFGFNPSETVEVLDSCVDVSKGEKKRYEAISCHEWTLRRLRAMHQVGPAGGTAISGS